MMAATTTNYDMGAMAIIVSLFSMIQQTEATRRCKPLLSGKTLATGWKPTIVWPAADIGWKPTL